MRHTSVGHILQTAGLLCCLASLVALHRLIDRLRIWLLKKEEFTSKKENVEALIMSSSPTVHINR